MQKEEVAGRKKSIVLLNSTHAQFRSALKALDGVATRYTNTVFMLYVKEGQSRIQDILSNNQVLMGVIFVYGYVLCLCVYTYVLAYVHVYT